MNREERIFSVTMTEEELRLFSEFLAEQKLFREIPVKYDDRYKESSTSPKQSPEQRLADIELKEQLDAVDFVLGQKKEDFHKLQSHNRMTKKWVSEKDLYLQGLSNPEGKRFIAHPEDQFTLAVEAGTVSRMLAAENKLHRIGYDNKYSAKGLERILGKKIDADEAENIVKNRSALADTYGKNSSGYIHKSDKGILDDLGRRWDDAKMVYGEALDGRSLGKDAALAAAGATALGVGIHAIRKHRKKKKEAQAALDSKYKTKED